MISKRDFERLAMILGSENAPPRLVKRISNFCGGRNPRFSEDLFLAAVEHCRPERPKVVECAGCKTPILDPAQAATQFCRPCAEG